jgi:hypothetical protein
MSSGRNRDDCPDCGYRKPDHTAGCVFGAAIREGAAQARRRGMPPQVRALRGVVAEQFRAPLALDGSGISDLVDRIAAAVTEAMEQGIGLVNRNAPEPGTVDGIRPHRPVTPEQDARMKRAAEQWEKDNPVTPETAAAALAGWESHGPQGVAVAAGCPGCGAVPEQTRHGRVTLHAQACPRAVPRVPGPPTASGPLRTPGRYGECPQTERHTAHQWIGGVGDEVRYLCDGEPSTDGA